MTEFVETNALLALLSGDIEEADRLVRDMLLSERQALAAAAGALRQMCTERCSVCDDRMVVGDPRGYVASFPDGFGSGGRRIVHHSTCPLPEEQSDA